jgi:hypothetical protein
MVSDYPFHPFVAFSLLLVLPPTRSAIVTYIQVVEGIYCHLSQVCHYQINSFVDAVSSNVSRSYSTKPIDANFEDLFFVRELVSCDCGDALSSLDRSLMANVKELKVHAINMNLKNEIVPTSINTVDKVVSSSYLCSNESTSNQSAAMEDLFHSTNGLK